MTARNWPPADCPRESLGSADSTSWSPGSPTTGQVIVGIETDCGLWVTALIAAGYQVRDQSARRRDIGIATTLTGAKSDSGDAKILADLVRTDRHNHRQVAGDTAEAEAIRIVARGHQTLVWTRTRHTSMLRSALREY